MPGSSYVLELNQLPGRTTEDYDYIAESIKQIVSMYCACFTLDYVSPVQKQVYSHIQCNMSDCVNVNHCKMKLDDLLNIH